MKNQNTEHRIQNTEHRIQTKAVAKTVLVLCSVFLALFLFTAASEAKWKGVDESVVEKYAEEHGRKARDPLINTDQGDLLLFVFLLAGAVGGFTAGYYWRTLTENKAKGIDKR